MRRIALDLSPLEASTEFRRLIVGEGLSVVGGNVLYVVIPIQVYAETHSSLAVGLIGLVELGPLLVASILGGAIADVVERVRMVVRVELGVAAIGLLLAINAAAGTNVPVVYVLAGAATGVSSLGWPAARTLLPRYVPKERLAAANALSGTVMNFGAIAGPGIGGILVAVLDPTGAYIAGTIVVLAGAATFRLLPPTPPLPGEDAAERVSVRTILAGFRYVKGEPVVLGVFLADTTAMIFGSPRALFPAFAHDLGGSSTAVGLLYAMPYLGAFIASVASGWTSHVRRQGRWVNGMIVLWGVAIAGFGLAPNAVLALAFLALAGGADTLSAIFRSVIIQQETPDAMLGRVGGIELAQVAATPLIGDFEAGLVASLTSVRTSIVSGGVMCIAAIVVLTALVPALDRYRRPEPPAPRVA